MAELNRFLVARGANDALHAGTQPARIGRRLTRWGSKWNDNYLDTLVILFWRKSNYYRASGDTSYFMFPFVGTLCAY
jgi:hypothetical protein